MKSLIIIYKSIPIIAKSIIGGIVAVTIISYVINQFIAGLPIALSIKNTIVLILISLAVAFITGSINAIRKQLPGDEIHSVKEEYVSIGYYSFDNFSTHLRARSVKGEKGIPEADMFLKRVCFDDPFCITCKCTASTIHASWMADGVQIGYECKNCNRSIEIRERDLRKEVDGYIRRELANIWQKYKQNAKK